MHEKLGKRLELLMYEKGVGSPGRFAAYLKEQHPIHSVSEDTIRGLINGKGFQNYTLESIAIGLGLPIECLIIPDLPLVDAYLFGEVLEEKETGVDTGTERDYCIKELTWIKKLYDIDCRMYPSTEADLSNKCGFQISTLAELSIYFPLCNMRVLADVMCRLCGQIEGYEIYMLEKYAWIYNTIPDIPAKRFADYQVKKLRLSAKKMLSEDEKKCMQEIMIYEDSEESESDYQQYREIAYKYYELFSNIIVNDILKARVPEIYV